LVGATVVINLTIGRLHDALAIDAGRACRTVCSVPTATLGRDAIAVYTALARGAVVGVVASGAGADAGAALAGLSPGTIGVIATFVFIGRHTDARVTAHAFGTVPVDDTARQIHAAALFTRLAHPAV